MDVHKKEKKKPGKLSNKNITLLQTCMGDYQLGNIKVNAKHLSIEHKTIWVTHN